MTSQEGWRHCSSLKVKSPNPRGSLMKIREELLLPLLQFTKMKMHSMFLNSISHSIHNPSGGFQIITYPSLPHSSMTSLNRYFSEKYFSEILKGSPKIEEFRRKKEENYY